MAAGLRYVAATLAAVPRGGRFWEAKLYRQHGALLLLDNATAHAPAAETCLQQALHMARQQGARALNTRATARMPVGTEGILSRVVQKPIVSHLVLLPCWLTGSAAVLAHWRERLLEVLGPNGQGLIDMLPEDAMA
jgi:hypothetical protein